MWRQKMMTSSAAQSRTSSEALSGIIVEVIVTGANDVWVVQGPFGEILIPVIDDVVLGVSEDDGVIVVRLLDGLMPGEGEFE